MKLIDQNDQPITDPSALPLVDPARADAQAAVDANREAATADASAVVFPHEATVQMAQSVRDTAGKNGVSELPAILGTTGGDEVPEPTEDAKLSPRDQMVARLRNIRARLIAYASQLTTRPAAVAAFVTTAQSLDMAIAGASTLPPDWKPVRTSPTAALAEGIHVFVRSKYRALYQSDLSADDIDDMVIVRIGDKRLRCHCTASGASIFIPAGHVEVR